MPGTLALDIGALRGSFSSRMLDLVGRDGSVHAFEPNPAHQHRLQALAAHGRLDVHALALSDRTGQATLRIPLHDGRTVAGLASLEVRSGGDSETVEVATGRLDDVLPASSPVRFIKCDVEGHEDAVFRGARELLTRQRPSILVEIEARHRTDGVSRIFDHFSALQYAGWAVFPAGLRPLDAFDLERDQLRFLTGDASRGAMPRGYVHNFLFVPPGVDLGSSLADPSLSAGSGDGRSRPRISA